MAKLKTLKDIEKDTIIFGEPSERARPKDLPVHSSILREVAREWIKRIDDAIENKTAISEKPFCKNDILNLKDDWINHYYSVKIAFKHFFNLEE